jgi:selenide,water dikinase
MSRTGCDRRSDRNWTGYGEEVFFPKSGKKTLSDPQTSGGLLVACSPEAVPQVLEAFKTKGFAQACVIGKLSAGAPRLTVT